MFAKFISRSTRPLQDIIFFMGGPGSGKSIQAENFPEFNHVSTGNLIRTAVASGKHPQSSYFKNIMQKGELLSDQDMLALLSSSDAFTQSKPVILDGYPRTLTQWNQFKQNFGMPKAVIEFSVSADTMKQRMSGRNRADDIQDVMDHRIHEYFTATRPVAQRILDEAPESLIIEADNLNPSEVFSQIEDYLKSLGLLNHPAFNP